MDLLFQRVFRPTVVEDEVCDRPAIFTRELSGYSTSSVLRRPAALSNETFYSFVFWGIDDDDRVDLVVARLQQKRYHQHDYFVRMPRRREPGLYLFPHERVDDAIQIVECIVVGEDEFGKLVAVDTAVRPYDAAPEPGLDRIEGNRARLHDLTSDHIRVDHRGTTTGEQLRDRRLARPHSPGKTHQDHGRTVASVAWAKRRHLSRTGTTTPIDR